MAREWELTDSEIASALSRFRNIPVTGSTFLKARRAIALAQARQIWEWGEEDCPHAYSSGANVYRQIKLKRRECPECWQQLKQKIDWGP